MSQLSGDKVKFWKPKNFKDVLIYKAEFKKFAFDKHAHDEFAIGVMEKGVQKFYYKGSNYVASKGGIITVNPDDIHTGEPVGVDGYEYRIVHVNPKFVKEITSELYGKNHGDQFFKTPLTHDDEIAFRLHKLLVLHERSELNLLEFQSEFIEILTKTFKRYAEHKYLTDVKKDEYIVKKAKEYINENIEKDLTLDEISASVGLSKFHFLRMFKNTADISPHNYLMMRRVLLAKKAIEKGYCLSEVAHMAGFTDQSHLSRRFKALTGLTPGRYQKALLAS